MKAELEQRLGDILVEIEELVALQNRVTKGLEACKEPLRVTNLCLEERCLLFAPMPETLKNSKNNTVEQFAGAAAVMLFVLCGAQNETLPFGQATG